MATHALSYTWVALITIRQLLSVLFGSSREIWMVFFCQIRQRRRKCGCCIFNVQCQGVERRQSYCRLLNTQSVNWKIAEGCVQVCLCDVLFIVLHVRRFWIPLSNRWCRPFLFTLHISSKNQQSSSRILWSLQPPPCAHRTTGRLINYGIILVLLPIMMTL